MPLRSLTILRSHIHDLSPLAGMALRDLHLDYNQIEDISALKDSRSLTDLSLIGNRITDISALSGFSLRTANVSLNHARDLSPI